MSGQIAMYVGVCSKVNKTYISSIVVDFSSSYFPILFIHTLYIWNSAITMAYTSTGNGPNMAYKQ